MIDSVTIFSKTGLVLYHFSNITKSNDITKAQIQNINKCISCHLTDPTHKIIFIDSATVKSRSSSPVSIAEWDDDINDNMAIILYSKVISEHADMTWTAYFMKHLLQEYALFQTTDNKENQSLFNATHAAIYEKAQTVGKVKTNTNEVKVTKMAEPKAGKKGKEARVWHEGEQKVTSASMAKLDRSKEKSNDTDPMEISDSSPALMEARAAYLPAEGEMNTWEEEDEIQLVDDDESSSGWGGSLKGMMDQFSGKVLTPQDLEEPLKAMEKMLTGKNVAREIAQDICAKVRDKLVGRKMASFTRVKTAVRQALEGSIERILKPGMGRGGSDSVDVLRDVVVKRERGSRIFGSKNENKKPVVIVMVGINGVGKSTSLAKIAYYLKSNGCNPLLAACDTFRSGAVEQLSVHAKCLDVSLYHKGYAKDPAAVAKNAIDHATQGGHDVVLVDTAGRMQNNIPLMKALSNLVVQNNPDLVLFVCEALVGNDGIDQLNMFNKALRSGGHARQIDGIVLTKFDTVSDKVGAALTLTHLSKAPVVFCGTGQKYNHLKKLSVQGVIKSLFA